MIGHRCTLLIVCCLDILIFAHSDEVEDELEAQDYSRCAFPCSAQGTIIEQFDDKRLANFTADDPRVVVVKTATLEPLFTGYCIERSGPFYIIGRTIEGVNEYGCFQDTRYDEENTIRLLFTTDYRPFSGRPDICKVCNGDPTYPVAFINIEEKDCAIVIPKELDCNIPWSCPVVNSTIQKQCSLCEPYEDDGLCCDQKKK